MPPVRIKALIPVIALFIVTIFFWGADRYKRDNVGRLSRPVEHLGHSSSSAPTSQETVQAKTPDQLCDPDVSVPPPLAFPEWLVRKNYTRAYFRPHHVASDRPFSSLENIDQHVLQPFRSLDRGMRVPPKSLDDPWPCPSVIDVDVAADVGIEDTKHFLFGLATTVDRLDRLLPSLLYSYGSSLASVIVLVPEDTPNIPAQELYFRNRGLDVTIKPSPLDHTARYFGLTEAFTEHIKNVRPNTTWVSFVDDDTFFLDFPSLASRIVTLDPTKRHYIGSLSEAGWQVDTFGHIGFGGAGVFISVPLLERMYQAYDDCQALGDRPGDQKVALCIEKYGDTQLTLWPSLYQMDMNGLPDGVFESGRQIDSLHHWTSWYQKDVARMSTVAAAAGRRSVLRRWRFDELTTIDNKTGATKRTFWVLTNGYSLIKYTMNAKLPADSIKFDRTEKTWDEDERGYEKRLGLMRPKNQPGIKKERWMMLDSFVLGDNVHQTYSREEDETHSVIELVWLGPSGGGGAGVGPVRVAP